MLGMWSNDMQEFKFLVVSFKWVVHLTTTVVVHTCVNYNVKLVVAKEGIARDWSHTELPSRLD